MVSQAFKIKPVKDHAPPVVVEVVSYKPPLIYINTVTSAATLSGAGTFPNIVSVEELIGDVLTIGV